MKLRRMPPISASFLGFTAPFWWVKRSFLWFNKLPDLCWEIYVKSPFLLVESTLLLQILPFLHSFATSRFFSLQKCNTNAILQLPLITSSYIPCVHGFSSKTTIGRLGPALRSCRWVTLLWDYQVVVQGIVTGSLTPQNSGNQLVIGLDQWLVPGISRSFIGSSQRWWDQCFYRVPCMSSINSH